MSDGERSVQTRVGRKALPVESLSALRIREQDLAVQVGDGDDLGRSTYAVSVPASGNGARARA